MKNALFHGFKTTRLLNTFKELSGPEGFKGWASCDPKDLLLISSAIEFNTGIEPKVAANVATMKCVVFVGEFEDLFPNGIE